MSSPDLRWAPRDLGPQHRECEGPRAVGSGSVRPWGLGSRGATGRSWAPKAARAALRRKTKPSLMGPKLPSHFDYFLILNNTTKSNFPTFPLALPAVFLRGCVTYTSLVAESRPSFEFQSERDGRNPAAGLDPNGRVWTRGLTARRWEAEVQSFSHPQVGYGYEV